jgi:hypothetical protein
MTYQHAVLYDVEWQKLRVSFLSKNDDLGGFTTFKGAVRNMARLNDYVFGVDKDAPYPIHDSELAVRLWRAINLLNATRMGYAGQELKGTPNDTLVESFRDEYRKAYTDRMKLYVKKANHHWSWLKVLEDLKHLYATDRSSFYAIQEDLLGRERAARRRHNHVDDTRQELLVFLALMADTAELAARKVHEMAGCACGNRNEHGPHEG